MINSNTKTLVILYHFYWPDDVVSARLYADIGEWASSRGWRVVAMPAVRSCHDGETRFPKREERGGVSIRRVWRPAFSQASNLGRLLNTIFVLVAWTWRAMVTSRGGAECVIIGTDPPLGVLAAIPWKIFRRRAKIIHWCHDLYPDAAAADGLIPEHSVLLSIVDWLMRKAYRCCDLVIDLGICMKRRLQSKMGSKDLECDGKIMTVTPWALVEPKVLPQPNWSVRRELFGCSDSLGLLYSGNLGRAHSFSEFVELAKCLENSNAMVCFAGRGPKLDEIRTISQSMGNLRVAGFSSEEGLLERLSAADIHLVSLRSAWTGCVIPSKFFGALAVGRPVLFAGSEDSAIAKWIKDFSVGWVISDTCNYQAMAEVLAQLAEDRSKLLQMQLHCFEIYKRHFSKREQLQAWSRLLER